MGKSTYLRDIFQTAEIIAVEQDKFFSEMKPKKYNSWIFFLPIFLFVLLFLFGSFNQNRQSLFVKIKIKDREILAEIADNPKKREKGLSGRDYLPETHGMLFIFKKPDYYPFWMKGMKFPLDFIWINGDTIVEITPNVKPEDFQPPKVLIPSKPIDKVLEINSGMTEKLKIKENEKIN